MKNICKTCENFIQHYRLENQTFISVDCGHCIKKLKSSQKGCEEYKKKENKNIDEYRLDISKQIENLQKTLNRLEKKPF